MNAMLDFFHPMLDLEYIQSLPYITPYTDRRTVLILGGCSGLGWYTVLHLYLHGYVIYITGRSKSRVLKSIDELRQESINIRSNYTSQELNERYLGELLYLELDLSQLSSVLSAANKLINTERNLNILINNLSTNFIPYMKTQDGFEIQLQLNYISPFLLIIKLLPLLENTTNYYPEIEPPKIIYTSSPSHYFFFSYFSMDEDFKYKPIFFFNWIRYGKAKISGIHLIKMLSLRNPKILSTIVDPGFVMNPTIFSYFTRLPIIGILFWCLFEIFGYFFGSTMEEGSFSVIKNCLDPDLTFDDNGKIFDTNGKEVKGSRVANNMDYAARTWIWTINKLNEKNIHIPN
ncbi:probable oxidoreductase Env9p [[Candida] jaroonii]|uniref:Probable oxidoreductase Env9p n=1 Tax=[Candida] jaroonii TaxID=467808 RepID=A0ACA9Y319_9ASCO|nr:probable oxidoreductase Env9p [[Candida] jaroonii]